MRKIITEVTVMIRFWSSLDQIWSSEDNVFYVNLSSKIKLGLELYRILSETNKKHLFLICALILR